MNLILSGLALHPAIYLVGHSSHLPLLRHAATALRGRGVCVSAAHELVDTLPLAQLMEWQADRLIECDAVAYVGDWIERPEARHLTSLASMLGKRVVRFDPAMLDEDAPPIAV